MKRPLRISFAQLALVLVGVQVVLIACNGKDEPTPTPVVTATPTVAHATATPQPTPTATVPSDSGRTQGGVARFAVKEAPPHQDVHQSVSPVLATWGAGIAYSRLMKLQRGANVPVPSRIPECDLCTSWKQIGPLEFEFVIRDDAFWPERSPMSGRRVTAQDIAFSYQRQATTDWPNAELVSNFSEVAAISDDLLQIRLKTLDAEFLEKLANGRSAIVAQEAVEVGGNLIEGPTFGSGPWILEEISQEGASFEANRGYYGDGPFLDGLSVQFIAQATTRAAGVRADILDFAETTLLEVMAAQERFPELQTVTLDRLGTGVEVALNTARGPLGDEAVREAIFLAWDLEAVLADIWAGELEPSVGLNLPEPSWATDFGENYLDRFGDLAEAGRLIEESGISQVGQLTIMVGEFGESEESDRYIETAESLAAAMRAIGLSVEVSAVTTREFADEVWLGGDYDIFVGAPPPIDSLSGQLFSVYYSSGPWNTTGFADTALDDLIEQQAVELDRVSRGRLLAQIQNSIMSKSQRFYAATGREHWLWRPRVQNLMPDTSGASGDFLTRVWLQR